MREVITFIKEYRDHTESVYSFNLLTHCKVKAMHVRPKVVGLFLRTEKAYPQYPNEEVEEEAEEEEMEL